MKIRISIADIVLILLWLAVFRFYTPNAELYYIFQLVVCLGIFLFLHRYLLKIKNIGYIVIFPIIIIISSILNRNTIGMNQVIRGITYGVEIIDIFLVLKYYTYRKTKNRMFSLMYNLSKIYYVISIVQIILYKYMGELETVVNKEMLFTRGKFAFSYMTFIFLALLKNNNKIKKINGINNFSFIILSIISIYMCYLIQTSTGIVAIALYLLLSFVPEEFCKMLNNRIIMITSIVAAMVIIFSINIILSLHTVQVFLTSVLNEDLSLTGRTDLYSLLLPLLGKAGLFGNGFGSYVVKNLAYHGWYNAQNGLAEIILTYGYLGAAAFGLMIWGCVPKRELFNKSLLLLIYVFIVISVVEIPFSGLFIFVLALFSMNVATNENNIK